ncbi:MAG: hypothetical protein Q7T23_18430 [Phenylobacterium sp.]|nr:hypothetical protein [Phenylobacterium sp.]
MAKRKTKPLNDNEPRGLEVFVGAHRDDVDTWVVEAVDTGSEGEVYQTLFTGPKAEDLAYEYARFKYGV